MKTLFTIRLDHSIDIITNSSSELFVMKGKTKEIVKEAVSSVYPNYLYEYEEIKSGSELTDSEIETYISNVCYGSNVDHFMESLCLKGEEIFSNWEERKSVRWWSGEATENGMQELRKSFERQNLHFLFSIDENPNQEYQDRLEGIATRYHLG